MSNSNQASTTPKLPVYIVTTVLTPECSRPVRIVDATGEVICTFVDRGGRRFAFDRACAELIRDSINKGIP